MIKGDIYVPDIHLLTSVDIPFQKHSKTVN